MSTFVCSVVDSRGKREVLRREAAHEAAVLRDLNQEGYFIISVKPASSAVVTRGRKLRPTVVLEFTQMLATLMANGLRLKEALGIARRIGGRTVGPVLQHVEERVERGDSLFESLVAWQPGFSALYLGLVRIGEKTGDLATIFQRLSDYLVGRQTLRAKTVNSLVYPAFVLGVAVIGIVLLATLVLPNLTGMIGSINPAAAALYQRNVTRFQAGAGLVVGLLAAVVACGVLSFRLRSSHKDWAGRLDAFFLKIPLVRTLMSVSFGLNFSFAMETLLTSGYPLEEALQESSWVVSNLRFRDSLLRARESVVKGVLLSEALRQENVFPSTLIGWMAVGEGAHDLVRSFGQVRIFYQQETDKISSRFMNLAEPALIVTVGIILITLILTFITPIFTMLGGLL
jgi:type IV pilus assembly protein PilC